MHAIHVHAHSLTQTNTSPFYMAELALSFLCRTQSLHMHALAHTHKHIQTYTHNITFYFAGDALFSLSNPTLCYIATSYAYIRTHNNKKNTHTLTHRKRRILHLFTSLK